LQPRPYRPANATVGPTAAGSACAYETANFRYITPEVTYEGGTQEFSMTGMLRGLRKGGGGKEDIANHVKKNFTLDDGTELSGGWDEASLTPMNCCIFSGPRGDQLITIDFTASPATLHQTATLVDSADKRMEQPPKIDGSGGVAAAKALNGGRLLRGQRRERNFHHRCGQRAQHLAGSRRHAASGVRSDLGGERAARFRRSGYYL
jgi:hypothetical protein